METKRRQERQLQRRLSPEQGHAKDALPAAARTTRKPELPLLVLSLLSLLPMLPPGLE